MFTIFSAPRHLRRYREISQILARHGLGFLVRQLGLGGLLPFHRGLLGHPRRADPYTAAEHLRMALEEIGTAFIKLGQILSTRPDLLPLPYILEFAKLQDAAPPVPKEAVEEAIQQELGAPPDKIFHDFQWEPVASASIGQVHAARLDGGQRVVIKVQRPGVHGQVEEDLEILHNLARLAMERTPLSEYYDLLGMVEEFSFTLKNELDYTQEGENAERFRREFADDPTVYIPQVYWDYSTPQVITIEKIQGIKINNIKALDTAGADRHLLAERSVAIMLKEVFEKGFFHADPHPGNFFVMDGEVIGLMDYGMVGQLDEKTQWTLLRLTNAALRKDTERILDIMLSLGVVKGRISRLALKRELDHFIDRYWGAPIAEIAAANVVQEVMALALRYRLQLPTNLALLAKVMAMSEGLGAMLDPDFRLAPFMQPYVRRFLLRRYSPASLLGRMGEGLGDLLDLGWELPRRLDRILGQVERGEIRLTTQAESPSLTRQELHLLGNRLAVSILVAAIVIGLALLTVNYQPPGWEILAGIIFFSSFLLALVLILWLLFSVWRS